MNLFPFPSEEEAVEAWGAITDVLDKAIKEDIATIDDALQKLYGRPLTTEEGQFAQLLLTVVAKSTQRLSLAIVNTYMCTDRAKREQLNRLRLRMEGKPEPEET